MKVSAIIVYLLASSGTAAASAESRKLLASTIAPYRRLDGCHETSCDPCKALQKKQCKAEPLCEYDHGVDNTFTHGDAGSGSGCTSVSARQRVTHGHDGSFTESYIRDQLTAMPCGEFYSSDDCRIRGRMGGVGSECYWRSCEVDPVGYPYCATSDEDKSLCPNPPPPSPPPSPPPPPNPPSPPPPSPPTRSGPITDYTRTPDILGDDCNNCGARALHYIESTKTLYYIQEGVGKFFKKDMLGGDGVGGDVTFIAGGPFRGNSADGAYNSFNDNSDTSFQVGRVKTFTVDPSETYMYVFDTVDNGKIRRLDLENKMSLTWVGGDDKGHLDGTGTGAKLQWNYGCIYRGDYIYFTEHVTEHVRKVHVDTAVVTTIAGTGNGGFTDGASGVARLWVPRGITATADGSVLYVADQQNNRIRTVLTSDGTVDTLAGSGTQNSGLYQGNDQYNFDPSADGVGTAANMGRPIDVVLSPDEETLYVLDQDHEAIRTVNLATKQVDVQFTVSATNSPDISNRVLRDPVYMILYDLGHQLIVADGQGDSNFIKFGVAGG